MFEQLYAYLWMLYMGALMLVVLVLDLWLAAVKKR